MQPNQHLFHLILKEIYHLIISYHLIVVLLKPSHSFVPEIKIKPYSHQNSSWVESLWAGEPFHEF